MTNQRWVPYQGIKPRKKSATRKPRTNLERDLVHLPVMAWAKRHPICSKYLIHIANERKTSEYQGAMLKRMGVRAGVSDLLLAFPAKGFNGFWIELKAPGNAPTASQKEWFELMEVAGYKTGWFDDAERTIIALKEYLECQ